MKQIKHIFKPSKFVLFQSEYKEVCTMMLQIENDGRHCGGYFRLRYECLSAFFYRAVPPLYTTMPSSTSMAQRRGQRKICISKD